MSLIGPWNILAGASNPTGYTIDQSTRWNAGDSPHLDRTPGTAGDRRTWTWSSWVKKEVDGSHKTLFSAGSGAEVMIRLRSGNQIHVLSATPGVDDTVLSLETTAQYRDPAAWYHIVLAIDTTDGTAADRAKIYVNGDRVTSFVTETNISTQNLEMEINNTTKHSVGMHTYNSGDFLAGYLAEVHFIDGQALTPASFAETNEDTNQWTAIKYAGTYGTNGFYQKYEDSADLGNDSSGNGNDYTNTNLVVTDQVPDTPTNNFCTLSPIVKAFGTVTWTEGNLKAAGSAVYQGTVGTILAGPSGKWYWEHYIHTVGNTFTGVVLPSDDRFFKGIAEGPQQGGKSITYNNNGYTYIDGSQSGSIWGATYTTGDIIGIAVDMDTSNGQVTFYKNGSSQGTLSFTGNNMSDATNVVPGTVLNTATSTFNFGQDSSFVGEKTAQGNSDANGIGDFYYTVPAGHLAVCTSNLSDPSIAISGENFNPVIYTGNAAASHAVTGVGFQPDLTWLKKYEDTDKHTLYDAVRTATYYLTPDTTAAENQENTSLKSFDSDGFTVGDWDDVNGNGSSFVSWNWLAGGGAGSSNTDGDTNTTSTSANVTAGFSISILPTYSGGTTFGHGLAQAPELVIMKPTNGVDVWLVGSDPVGWTKGLVLNTTATPSANTVYWNNTAPTATVVSLGTQGNSYIKVFYCFHSVEGYSKVGSWVGNGNADGTFIYTGFRPAMVLSKDISSANNWVIVDDARNTYNVANSRLRPNTTAAQSTDLTCFDFVSNGFKVRTSDGDLNADTYTYIYLAFAEFPFKYSNAR